MDYEKKIRDYMNSSDIDTLYKSMLNNLFPELAESEDEKIRKELIFYLGDMPEDTELRNGVTNRDVLAWLEKQGEQKPSVEMKTPEESLNIDSKTYNEIVNDCIFGENKPKFKVGDWISGYYTSYQVLSINNEGYVVEDVDGNKINILLENEKFHHLWTIKDAKDGDVLIDKSGSREGLFIFKETKPSDIKTDVLNNPLTVLGYCGIGGAGFTKGSGWGDTANCTYYPATKEQRDQLEKAMVDAGYTFDFEKKELKKIEQKPAWSEEDETIALSIEQVINCASLLNIVPEKIDKIRTWLKSLKERL